MINRVLLVGNVGRDPEIRFTQRGDAVCNFTLATSETWKKSGSKHQATEWHNVVAWGKTAEFVNEYIKKGRMVLIEGRLQTRHWEDNNKVKHYRTEVVANTVRFIGPDKNQNSRDSRQDEDGPPLSSGGGEYMDDDIPF